MKGECVGWKAISKETQKGEEKKAWTSEGIKGKRTNAYGYKNISGMSVSTLLLPHCKRYVFLLCVAFTCPSSFVRRHRCMGSVSFPKIRSPIDLWREPSSRRTPSSG